MNAKYDDKGLLDYFEPDLSKVCLSELDILNIEPIHLYNDYYIVTNSILFHENVLLKMSFADNLQLIETNDPLALNFIDEVAAILYERLVKTPFLKLTLYRNPENRLDIERRENDILFHSQSINLKDGLRDFTNRLKLLLQISICNKDANAIITANHTPFDILVEEDNIFEQYLIGLINGDIKTFQVIVIKADGKRMFDYGLYGNRIYITTQNKNINYNIDVNDIEVIKEIYDHHKKTIDSKYRITHYLSFSYLKHNEINTRDYFVSIACDHIEVMLALKNTDNLLAVLETIKQFQRVVFEINSFRIFYDDGLFSVKHIFCRDEEIICKESKDCYDILIECLNYEMSKISSHVFQTITSPPSLKESGEDKFKKIYDQKENFLHIFLTRMKVNQAIGENLVSRDNDTISIDKINEDYFLVINFGEKENRYMNYIDTFKYLFHNAHLVFKEKSRIFVR